MQDRKEKENREIKKEMTDKKPVDPGHIGSSNAFEETENPLSRDPDNVSDERLDEIMGDE